MYRTEFIETIYYFYYIIRSSEALLIYSRRNAIRYNMIIYYTACAHNTVSSYCISCHHFIRACIWCLQRAHNYIILLSRQFSVSFRVLFIRFQFEQNDNRTRAQHNTMRIHGVILLYTCVLLRTTVQFIRDTKKTFLRSRVYSHYPYVLLSESVYSRSRTTITVLTWKPQRTAYIYIHSQSIDLNEIRKPWEQLWTECTNKCIGRAHIIYYYCAYSAAVSYYYDIFRYSR